MKPNPHHPELRAVSRQPKRHRRGFALVVTLTLMILLTILSVGLLTLSSVTLRNAGQGEAQQIAQANARLALAMAIAQLQKHTGPDQRVTVTADQRTSGGSGGQSSAAIERRQWAGVYRSWLDTSANRPTPEFLSWLVSGEETLVSKPETADQAGPAADSIELVGAGTLGTAAATGQVKVPAIRIAQGNGRSARAAWWVGDQGVKAAISAPPASKDTSQGMVRATLQAAPRSAVEWAKAGTTQPFSDLKPEDSRMPMVTSWQQAELIAADPAAPKAAFHDLAPFSTGLMTNVRAGGFRKDLSMHLERDAARAPNTPLYTVNRTENGINFQELWAYYNLYKEVQRRGSATFSTGGRLGNGTAFLQVRNNPNEAANDNFFFFKQPVIVNYQMVFSFEVRPIGTGTNIVNSLRLVADPIITLWNPLDLPIVIPQDSFMSVKYWQYPYDIYIRVNGGPQIRSPMISSLTGATSTTIPDYNFLTLRLGNTQPLALKPGEVIKFSQVNNTIVREGFSRNLDAGPGFKFEGGVSLPLRDVNGRTINLLPSDTITYEVRPNNLTAGKTSSSGNSLNGANVHSRHFSITHHEVYIGYDRTGDGPSVGYGGMGIDWDFGNQRLKPGAVRASGQAGTKPPSERLYADNRTLSTVFKSIDSRDARSYSFSELNGRKSPFMLLSFEAKTEQGSDRNTRTLPRFNPKAHFVDFYDLKTPELDMMPYEFRLEPLTSWRNRSLEVSTNGNAYFGGGMNAEFGASFISTHTVPREPLYSIAMFQHSFANGFEMQKPTVGYATLNCREPMLPHIGHAIGNSLAPPSLAPDRTETTLPGNRPFADHSFLANRALWDDWFLSGIAPQTVTSFANRRDQRTVATDFFSGKTPLPVTRYLPSIGSEDPAEVVRRLISGTTPSNLATTLLGSLLRVDGMFNVNSTSVEAWKCILGGLKGRPIIVRDANGVETLAPANTDTVPVANLAAPANQAIKANAAGDPKEPTQWVGYRELNEEEIDLLARAIVEEVRKRGPFLSLADFVNRRPGTDKELARAGTIQSALDSPQVPINKPFQSFGRSVTTDVAARFTFPEAEEGAKSFGSPGIVKQGDILTPIAPILSARSDSFIIRAYGEAVAGDGKVIARAWCEAVVERTRDFVDPADLPETVTVSLKSNLNKSFGRRYQILSFRWLNPGEV